MASAAPKSRSPLLWLLAIAAPLIGAAGVLFGVIVLGRLLSDHLGDRARVEFSAIDCAPPPGMSRQDFLDEVRVYAERAGRPLPDQLEANDDLTKKLVEAFFRYPYVENVEGITVLPDNRVRVRLRYRRPVLAAQVDGKRRAVESRGALLPGAAPTEGLPFLRDAHFSVAKGEVLVWGDERVKAAASTAAFLQDNHDRLVVAEIGGTTDKLELTTASGATVIWGHAPGAEPAGEAAATRKCEVLIAHELPSGLLDLRQPASDR